MKITTEFSRTISTVLVGVVLLFVSGCACKPADPTKDRGFFDTVCNEISGGYEENTEQKKNQATQSRERGEELTREQQKKQIEASKIRQKLAYLRSEIGELDRDLGEVEERIRVYRAQTQYQRDAAREYSQKLNKLKDDTRLLDSRAGQASNSSDPVALESELASLKQRKSQLHAVYEAILY